MQNFGKIQEIISFEIALNFVEFSPFYSGILTVSFPSACHSGENLPSPKQTTSAPSSRSERISFRDKPVLWSGGWGGGKKRGKVPK